MKKAILTAAVLVAPTLLSADYYVQGFGALNWANKTLVEGLVVEKHDHDLGWRAGAAVGMPHGEHARLELEASYSCNNHDTTHMALSGVTYTDGGSLDILWLMANGYYKCTDWTDKVTPYVGAGVGTAVVWAERTIVQSCSQSSPNWSTTEGAFAYQAIVGFDVPVSDGWDVFGEYRFSGTGNVDLTYPAVAAGANGSVGPISCPPIPLSSSQGTLKRIHNHSIVAGVRANL